MKSLFLNINQHKMASLLGFTNGVYDLKRNEFRQGVSNDDCTLKLSIEYTEYNETDPLVKEVYDFFEKIFPDQDLREYFMDVSSDLFVGDHNKNNKHVYFWSGDGDNGKSVTELFLEKVLGEYSVKLPTSVITNKHIKLSPELIRARFARMAVVQEPDEKETINVEVLKELTGSDRILVRGLYQESQEIKPMFNLNVICNNPPKLSYDDEAAWTRIRVFPFESRFSDNAPETREEQLSQKVFPKDPFFSEKIPRLIKPFTWVLLNHLKKGPKFVEPEKVKMATDSYRKANQDNKNDNDDNVKGLS